MSQVPTESGFEITRGDERSLRVVQTPSRRADVRATAYCYHVGHPEVETEVRLLWAAGEERWVEARGVSSLLPGLGRLEGRLRLTIESHRDGLSLCALRRATPNAEGWATLTDVSIDELSRSAGVPIGLELRRVGALDVGPRAVALGDTGRARNRLIAIFPDENEEVPVLAYVLTRLAPLVRAFVRNGPYAGLG